MATFVKYIMDIYFERLAIEHKYDKYLLQQSWDETNTIMKNVLFEYMGTNFPSIINEKAQSKTCNHNYHKKGELKLCGHKVSGPNRKTCYRHTPELQTILKKKKSPSLEKSGVTCTFVPSKGKYKGTICGDNVSDTSGTICTNHKANTNLNS
jgi:hypothetical protein